MDGKDVINHLLEIEDAASKIVRDAEDAADTMLATGEHDAHAYFESEYSRVRAELETSYNAKCAELNEKRQKELDIFKESLYAKQIHQERFNEALSRFLDIDFLDIEGGA